MKISFVGLGNMGIPMAENLLNAGHELTLYNRTYKEIESFDNQQVTYAKTPLEAARESDITITMLSDDKVIEEVALGKNGILHGLPSNGIHISASTISIEMSKKLTEAHQSKSQYFLSATVLGRPDAAKAAKLRVLLAGPKEARDQSIPVLEALSQEIFIMGDDPATGNATKLGVNFLIASMIESLAESQLLVEKYGVTSKNFMEVVNALFQSPIYQHYGSMMVKKQFEPAGFKMNLGRKDVQLAIDAASSVQSPLPLAELIHGHFSKGINQGYGELDWTALIKCLKDSPNIDKV
ncbi:NAD(P)-dependent oxidoreductase [Gracilibacillus suaedae]|uniref:NAD(P)-dependent oxidoreductase n=1 Tax=Gracilibacillus suaedae TaxID=2820273 RepID=UPI001ABE90B8|nr:NAD(P)-dependent oxidoreductase [Gracilibacillus suaedae]